MLRLSAILLNVVAIAVNILAFIINMVAGNIVGCGIALVCIALNVGCIIWLYEK